MKEYSTRTWIYVLYDLWRNETSVWNTSHVSVWLSVHDSTSSATDTVDHPHAPPPPTVSDSNAVFCLGFFCRARRPAPFSWCPALLKKPKWRPALLTKKNYFFFLNISHMAFSSVLPFLLPTHSVGYAVHLLLNHSRALLVSSALFHPFTALIMPFFFSSPR